MLTLLTTLALAGDLEYGPLALPEVPGRSVPLEVFEVCPDEFAVVELRMKQLRLAGSLVGTMRRGVLTASGSGLGRGALHELLYEELTAMAIRGKECAANGESEFAGRLLLVVDRRIPSGTIQTLLSTAAQGRFVTVVFAVSGPATESWSEPGTALLSPEPIPLKRKRHDIAVVGRDGEPAVVVPHPRAPLGEVLDLVVSQPGEVVWNGHQWPAADAYKRLGTPEVRSDAPEERLALSKQGEVAGVAVALPFRSVEGSVEGIPMFHHSELHPVARSMPQYPRSQASGRAGDQRCLVHVWVDATGTPTKVRGEECAAPFSEVAEAAIMEWRWDPPVYLGETAAARTMITVKFKLR